MPGTVNGADLHADPDRGKAPATGSSRTVLRARALLPSSARRMPGQPLEPAPAPLPTHQGRTTNPLAQRTRRTMPTNRPRPRPPLPPAPPGQPPPALEAPAEPRDRVSSPSMHACPDSRKGSMAPVRITPPKSTCGGCPGGGGAERPKSHLCQPGRTLLAEASRAGARPSPGHQRARQLPQRRTEGSQPRPASSSSAFATASPFFIFSTAAASSCNPSSRSAATISALGTEPR